MTGRQICAALCAAGLIACTCGTAAGAVTVDWDDLTDAQQEQAYRELESENQRLREQLAKLQETSGGSASGAENAPGGGASGSGSAPGGESTSNAGETSGAEQASGGSAADAGANQAAQEAQASEIRSVDAFLADIALSFDSRQEIARTCTPDEVNAMSAEDMWAFRFRCAEAERGFYDTYNCAQFDDLNILYLCTEYCGGLGKQYQAEEIWNSSGDQEEANRLYTAGYYNRAYALSELCDYYGLDLAEEYGSLKSAVAQMDALSGEETRNASVDPEKVRQVQELLNAAGFLCGAPDGIAGRQTASCIERFQVMYGYEPADGIIDDELVGQLTEIIARRQG